MRNVRKVAQIVSSFSLSARLISRQAAMRDAYVSSVNFN